MKNNDNKVNGITINNKNPYHNYFFNDVFNTSSVFGLSYFATEPMFSRTEGVTDSVESVIMNEAGNEITRQTFWNDMIICEPWSGLVIRGDTSFQMNFLYDSFTPTGFKEYLMPYILYQKRIDIDGAKARDLFNDITLYDERMRLVFILTLIIGGILASAGGSLFVLTLFRNRERSKILRELRMEDEIRKKAKMMKKAKSSENNETQNSSENLKINNSIDQE